MKHNKSSLEANRELFYEDDSDWGECQTVKFSDDDGDCLTLKAFADFSCAFATIELHTLSYYEQLMKFVKKYRKPILFTAGEHLAEKIQLGQKDGKYKNIKKLTTTDGWYDQAERGMPPQRITLYQVTL